MSYQVIARKFRPKTFEDVIGQEAIVKTLKNALATKRLAHAYLFCGLRGTGKTTLARLLAKAMNCLELQETINPCGSCSSCRDFQNSQPLDFIEIDGASHRGIDDVKTIIDTLTYSSLHQYKIILIDEVHMLTKEAFNALLKTLEEPPEHVKFIFATTEAHKLPATILSRCQRFDLARITQPHLVTKLKKIALQLELTVEEAVFDLIAERAEGSLRDAESLFERIIATTSSTICLSDVYDLLGYFHTNLMEKLDLIIGQKNFKEAFTLAENLFSSGKDVKLFFDQFRQHLRHIACAKLNLQAFITHYPLKQASIDSYSLHEANYLLEVISEQLKTTSFDKKIDTEALLLHMIQAKGRASLQDIIAQLETLSQSPQLVPAIPEPAIATVETVAPTPKLQAEAVPPQESLPLKPPQFYDTVMQFAAVELEGSLKK